MKIIKKMLVIFIAILAVLVVVVTIVLQHKTFGAKPVGERLERIKQSPQYKDGRFENTSHTPMMTEETSYWKLIGYYTWNKPTTEPAQPIPSVKPDFKGNLTPQPTITWFGHASYLLQWNGTNILMDPVLSGKASPFAWLGVKSYQGADVVSVEELPAIDVVLLSHDHYDHLDYETIVKLSQRVKKFVVPLGVGAHLEHWGVDASKITELDWWDTDVLVEGIRITATPARHFSGRGLFDRGTTLWASYVLTSANYNLYIGGDSGYDNHFKIIGEKFGPFDLAILECGQYHPYWHYIHMMPEEVVQASVDLKTKVLLPVHWAKFTLALHSWNEPILRLSAEAKKQNIQLTTPRIGERVIVDSIYPAEQWW